MIEAVQYILFCLGYLQGLGHVTSWHVKVWTIRNIPCSYEMANRAMTWCLDATWLPSCATCPNALQVGLRSSSSRVEASQSSTALVLIRWDSPVSGLGMNNAFATCAKPSCIYSSLFTSPSPCMSEHICRDWYNRNSWTHHSVKHGPLASFSHWSNGSLGPILGSTLGTTRTLQGIPSFK